MSGESVLYAVEGGVATLTLNRPEKLNAYTTEMGELAVAAFRRARADADVGAVILTGAGRGFCAGVDLEHLKAHQAGASAGSGPRLGEEEFLTRLPLELLEYPKPVIAAVNGAAIGVGVTMILPCDVRLAASSAKLGLPFVKLGLLPGLGSTHLLPRLVGPGRARELVLGGRVIAAAEAAEIGLVNRVLPDAELLPAARALAAELSQGRPEVVAAAKAALRHGEEHGMAEAMAHERRASAELRGRGR
jgi:2-(1,2-epoxy-1,2-dihydrophenyl)acetyl-CoA isomerase